MKNEISDSIGESEEDGENELLATRHRFESLPAYSREAWLERARKILPPSTHNDPDAVLFAALELMFHDKALKGAAV